MVSIEVDIVLFPHCDIHVALHDARPLNLRVALRGYEAAPAPLLPPLPPPIPTPTHWRRTS